ncbi:MAG: ATP-binding cassette domain-containing protein [Eubacterium sp.]|nr:ATP-binding cassette domain-containing protein [Eubacterium sp.]
MIEIRGLKKSFGNRIIFEDFNLDIPDKSFVIISGDSGSGKTTLMNIIGGLESVDGGSVIVNSVDVLNPKNKRKIYKYQVGFLFQNFALLENKTVRQNLELIQKDTRTDVGIEEALEYVGIKKLIDEKVYKLSGGEQQRVALARLMIKKCEVVLADEPTGSLDEKNGKMVMEVLHKLNNDGKTVIVVTHDKRIVSEEEFVVKI